MAKGTPDDSDKANSTPSGQAEQRILGSLDGGPGWSEVMDMGSGEVYFWNSVTNEVVWDPPPGSFPR